MHILKWDGEVRGRAPVTSALGPVESEILEEAVTLGEGFFVFQAYYHQLLHFYGRASIDAEPGVERLTLLSSTAVSTMIGPAMLLYWPPVIEKQDEHRACKGQAKKDRVGGPCRNTPQ